MNFDAIDVSNRVFYFAYGSCMGDDFRYTVPEFVRHGLGVLNGYRLTFTRYSASRQGGVVDIVIDEERVVEGVLYDFDESWLEELDYREGVFSGAYRRTKVVVETSNGPVEAWTYEVVHKADREIPPHNDYAQLMLDGAGPYVTNVYFEWLKCHIETLNTTALIATQN